MNHKVYITAKQNPSLHIKTLQTLLRGAFPSFVVNKMPDWANEGVSLYLHIPRSRIYPDGSLQIGTLKDTSYNKDKEWTLHDSLESFYAPVLRAVQNPIKTWELYGDRTYTAVIEGNSLKVGCVTVPKEVVLEIAEELKKQ